MQKVVGFFSSLGLSCTLLILLAILTWLGTLEQVDYGLYDVQKKYFESFFLVHWAGGVPIPLPGANLVLCVLFVNILVGGIVRLCKDKPSVLIQLAHLAVLVTFLLFLPAALPALTPWWYASYFTTTLVGFIVLLLREPKGKYTRTAGIMIAHVGIAFLLLAGFVKLYHSSDGHVTFFEGDRKDYFESYYRWEIVATRDLGDGRIQEVVAPMEAFMAASGAEPATLTSSELPFDLEVHHVMRNCGVMQKGPMFDVDVPVVDGVFLREQPPAKEAEQNIAGAYVTVVGGGERREGVLFGLQFAPWTVNVDGEDWAIDLRHERYRMPFAVELDKFTKEDHPGISMARSFESDVRVTEGGSTRDVKISMNEPLRDGGLVLYQASWGPSNARPGDPLFSTLSVVRNPADQYPLRALVVIGVGLVLHFTRKLTKYVVSEARQS